MNPLYTPRRESKSVFIETRGVRYHCRVWGDASMATPERPSLVLVHGWMDVAASWQFMVDALREERHVVALDWRGFGLSEPALQPDTYWFADYLADLDLLLDAPELGLPAGQPIDLAGHSMGGNVVMLYAGIRPERIRRLINLEGFGMPATRPQDAARRYRKWLDELRQAATLRTYASVDEVAQRLMQNNPRLSADRAAWLAPHWSRVDAQGRWHILGDPVHKRAHPLLYRVDEVLAVWALIEAPVLWVEGDLTDVSKWWGQRYTLSEFHERLAHVRSLRKQRLSPAGHMLHHDQPDELAALVHEFLS